MCAYNFRDISASPVIHPMESHSNKSSIRKFHNWIVGKEISRPVTNLGHQRGEEIFERSPNFLNYVE